MQVRLVLLDEVHLVHESRGACLEAGVVSRLKLVQEHVNGQNGDLNSKLRFICCSATIPNVQDVAQWLEIPQEGIKVFGEEMRPVPLTVHVKSYNNTKNSFLFDKWLTKHVPSVIDEYSRGKPALVFCPSRSGAVSTASKIAQDAKNHQGYSKYVNSEDHAVLLEKASRQVSNSTLKECIKAGIGFHHAALEPKDKTLVESLFLDKVLQAVCTTSTLAVGVNFPAYLVVIKGTVRYAGSGQGYVPYETSACLQMIGRAGRPQFDTNGVAVIMTDREVRSALSSSDVPSILV